MPIQVIQRNDDSAQQYQNFQQNMQKQQEMLLKAREIKQTTDMERERLKILSKSAQTDEQKMKTAKDAQDIELAAKYVDYLIKANTNSDGTFDGEGFEKSATQLLMQEGNEGVLQQFSRMQGLVKGRKFGDVDAAETGAKTDKARAESELMRKFGGDAFGTSGVANNIANDLQGSEEPIPNAVRPRAAALSSAARPEATAEQGRGGRPLLTRANIGPFTFENPEARAKIAAMETEAREGAKPLSMEASRVYGNTETINNAIDNITKLLDETGDLGVTQQARVDFGQPLATGGKLKDITLTMNRLKNLIPFSRGGKQLTPFEAKLVFRLLNTVGKSNKQIKSDLEVYRTEFNKMVEAITTPRGKLDTNKVKSYEFGKGISKAKTKTGDADPLGLF